MTRPPSTHVPFGLGDVVRLGDTALAVQVDADDVPVGQELLAGCGRTLRDGIHVTSGVTSESQLDLAVTGVLLIDPLLGVRRTSIGVKDGRVVAVGRAGNPDLIDDPEVVLGPQTVLIPGEGLIATPGIVDSHVHLSSPALVDEALSAGTTTVVGMGLGGVWDLGVGPATNLRTLAAAWADVPLNAAFLARGSTTNPALLEQAMHWGASGFKVHEDLGATPAHVDTALTVADHYDAAVALHTDSLGESSLLADTLDALAGRTVHAYHVEGGGGHPDLLEVLNHPHVLASSTTPTLPLTVASLYELPPMTMTVHRQDARSVSDRSVTASRIRANGIAAENVLHDTGAISIINSDALGMGRAGEVARRTWQLAHVHARSENTSATPVPNNERVLRYLAKITVNPAIAHGLSGHVGTLSPGRLADIVLWQPAWFGVKAELVLKSGFVVHGVSGTGAGATRGCQPRRMRHFFGAMGGAAARLSVVFTAAAGLATADEWLLPGQTAVPVDNCRNLTRSDMVANTAVPSIRVPSDGTPVLVDGAECHFAPVAQLPLTRLHSLA